MDPSKSISKRLLRQVQAKIDPDNIKNITNFKKKMDDLFNDHTKLLRECAFDLYVRAGVLKKEVGNRESVSMLCVCARARACRCDRSDSQHISDATASTSRMR
jgi:hypothetical protein